ncbi:MAG: filamentous hemagglutinin N-terminal domain-containing protein [Desulfobacteraceae bacterium]|jgi:filamentous hemagglutinin family protein
MQIKSSHDNVFKKKMTFLMMTALCLWGLFPISGPVLAGPQDGVVTSGTAVISQAGDTTNINQTTQKAAINWQSFSVDTTETVNFNQPGVSSVTLNRVIGNEKSVIEGTINATGQVFLLNSNGMLFTKDSSINTAGFLAGTLNITDEDFNSGRYIFKAGDDAGSIINMGTITAADGGYVALLGDSVSNRGVITAARGTAALASGDKITLNFNGNSLLNLTIDEGTLDSLVENKDAIYADGGNVILTAKAADDLISSQVNNSGIIQARTIDDLKGDIRLYAYNGATGVSGMLDASAPDGGDGGFIETSGDRVSIADSATITTLSAYGENGTWLVDPDGITIGDGGDITANFLSGQLAYNNITFSSTNGSGSDGDVSVNNAITWSADTTLMLIATSDININAAITASGANAGLTLDAGADININTPVALSGANAAMAMLYGGNYNILTRASYSGAITDSPGNIIAKTDPHDPLNGGDGVYGSIILSGSNANLSINGNEYVLINDLTELSSYSGVSGFYALAEDIDASATTYDKAVTARLNGTLAGLGHTIDSLTISYTNTGYSLRELALIKDATASSVIRDIGLTNVDITGYNQLGVASLVVNNDGVVKNAYATGEVASLQIDPSENASNFMYSYYGGGVGGLVGMNKSRGTISSSYADVAVTGVTIVGGLAATSDGVISDSHASGDVQQQSDAVIAAMATGGMIGGLVGTSGGTITNSYATGNVTADVLYNEAIFSVGVGGLVGTCDGVIANSFAGGDVLGGMGIGGLVGQFNQTGDDPSITNSHATGNVN